MEYYDGVWCFGQMINATVDRFLMSLMYRFKCMDTAYYTGRKVRRKYLFNKYQTSFLLLKKDHPQTLYSLSENPDWANECRIWKLSKMARMKSYVNE